MKFASLVFVFFTFMQYKSKIITTTMNDLELSNRSLLKKIEDFYLLDLVKANYNRSEHSEFKTTPTKKIKIYKFIEKNIIIRLKLEKTNLLLIFSNLIKKFQFLVKITIIYFKNINPEIIFRTKYDSFRHKAKIAYLRITLNKKECVGGNSYHILVILFLPLVPFIMCWGYRITNTFFMIFKRLCLYAIKEYYIVLNMLQIVYTLFLLIFDTPGVWSDDFSLPGATY